MKLRKAFGAANMPKTIAFGLILFCLCTASFAAKKSNVKTSSVATLSSFTFSPSITKNTVSGPDFRDYVATVPNSVNSITVFPVTTDPAATVKVNNVTVPSGSSSSVIPLSIGNNTIVTTVTASDGVTSNTYSIVITRQVSTVATLNTLTYNPSITTTAVTGPDYKDYTATVSSTVASIKVTPLATDPAAVVKVNGVTVAYGAASASIPLNVGANVIATVVTAPDGVTTKTYSITITRNAPPLLSSLSFNPSITKTTVTGTHFRDYTATVPNTVTSIKVIPTAATPLLTIKVNGTAVASGAASAAIPLNAGDNTITTVVTEADGITTNTYSTVITRQKPTVATLNSLSFTPVITKTTVTGPDFRDYTATVANQVSSIKVLPVVTDPAATVKVNGTVVASGGSSASIPLVAGSNTITTVVTAADGVTANTYKTVITRSPSNDAALVRAIFYYHGIYSDLYSTVNGTNYQAGIKINPFALSVTMAVRSENKTATIKVNGTTVANDQIFPIELARGPNLVNITITAGDGVTSKTYLTPVYFPNDVALSQFYFDPAVSLLKLTGPDYEDYGANVPYSQSSVKIFTAVHNPNPALVTVKINGIEEIPGTESEPFPLPVGNSTISIVVSSKDGLDSNIYKIMFIRRTGPVAAAQAYTKNKQQSPITTDVVVPASLSPNGDGVGDKFLIGGIAAYPENKLMIISRAGALVYQATGYDNVSKVFDGRSSITGKLQQAGTYFYSLDYKADGQAKRKTGYIILKY